MAKSAEELLAEVKERLAEEGTMPDREYYEGLGYYVRPLAAALEELMRRAAGAEE
jgi:hypothetical protein